MSIQQKERRRGLEGGVDFFPVFFFLHLLLMPRCSVGLGNTQSPYLCTHILFTFLYTHTHSTPTHTSSHMCSHSKRALHPLTLTPTQPPTHSRALPNSSHSLPSHPIPSPPTITTTTERTHVYTHTHTHTQFFTKCWACA